MPDIPPRDRRNLYRAAEFGLGLSDTWRNTAELLLQCIELISQKGMWRPWIPLLERIIEKCSNDDLALKGRLLGHLGIYYRFDRRLDQSLNAHEEAIRIARLVGDKDEIAYANLNLCRITWVLRRHPEAASYGQSALTGFVETGEGGKRLATTYNMLGLIAQSRGDLEKAEEQLRLSVDLWDKTGDLVSNAATIGNLAVVLESTGKIDEALQGYHLALSLLAPTDCELDKTRIASSLGTLYFNQGRLDKAEEAYLQANSPYLRRSGHLYYQAMTANNLGNLFLAQERLDEAERCLRKAMNLWKQSNASLMLANTMGTLAETLAAQEKPEQARPLFDEAINITTDYPDDAWGQRLGQKFALQRDNLSGSPGPAPE